MRQSQEVKDLLRYNPVSQLNSNYYTKNTYTAVNRLAAEYRFLKNLETPLVNVAANPSEKDLFIWQGILQGPLDTIYEGLVLKFELHVPSSYPYAPPKVVIYSDVRITHPYIFNQGEVCLEMFQARKDRTKGWNTTYSIYSILHQLQGFFFEGDDMFSKPHRLKKRRLIREQILKIKDDLVEYDKNKRILIEMEKIEKQKSIQNIVDEQQGLKLLKIQKANEEKKAEIKREK